MNDKRTMAASAQQRKAPPPPGKYPHTVYGVSFVSMLIGTAMTVIWMLFGLAVIYNALNVPDGRIPPPHPDALFVGRGIVLSVIPIVLLALLSLRDRLILGEECITVRTGNRIRQLHRADISRWLIEQKAPHYVYRQGKVDGAITLVLESPAHPPLRINGDYLRDRRLMGWLRSLDVPQFDGRYP